MLAGRLDDSYTVEVRRALTPFTVAKVGANSAIRFAPPFIATIGSGLGVRLATIGGAIAVGELAGLSAPLLIRFAGRFTRRTSICYGLLGIALGAGVCATSRSAVQFAIGLALMTMTKIVFDLGVIAWMTDRVTYARLGRAIGLTETAWAGGLFIGVVLMGLLTGVTSWRWGYVLAIVAIVVLAALLRQRLPAEPAVVRVVKAADHIKATLGAGWWVIIATMALSASAQGLFVTFGTWLHDEFGFTDTQLAIVIFGLGAVELIAASSTVRFIDHWGKQASVTLGAALIVPAGLGLAVLHGHLVGLALLALFIAGFEFSILAMLSLASSLVPNHPSTGLGLMVGAGTLGRAIMAPLATAAFSSQGMWLPAVMGSGCASLTVLCQWRYRLFRRRVGIPGSADLYT